ncbi:MAG TPA: DUF2069 domain-containing protein [Zeimonas sp.]|nr:DUF2069 domain-containing protein [Zeimonas sp.]
MTTEPRLRVAISSTTSGVALVFAAWILSFGFSAARTIAALAAALPLCAFLPSLARGRRRAYAALTLCLVAYLTFSLMELVANPAARAWASVSLLSTFALFVMLIAYLRVTRFGRADV